jgi:hypothetical protein
MVGVVRYTIRPVMTYRFRKGGLAQLARAPALHAGGHRFDSDILHFLKVSNYRM